MKTYIRFLTINYFKSLGYVFLVMLSLVFILNTLSELDFFRNIGVENYFPIFLSIINSPSMIFEMFPFIFLISTQLFFIKLFNNNEIEIFKYSGLKNTKIIIFLSIISFLTGILITTLFYNFSSSLKNFYLELKSPYTTDGKYLAVVTKNGLWIRDKINNSILVINSSKIEKNYLINNFITEFDNEYNVKRNIQSKKIDISKEEWIIYDAKINVKNSYLKKSELKLSTNFDFKRIQSLYSNLTSLNLFELYELRNNYKRLNYSVNDIDLQLLKLLSNPFFLFLMTIFAALMMFKIKRLNSSAFIITLGLFFSVIIYYFNNFFLVLGSTEKISLIVSVASPLLLLLLINGFMFFKINEK